MTKTAQAFILFIAFMTLAVGAPQSADADEVVGIFYRLGYPGKNGEKIWIAQFRATPDGKIWQHFKSGGKPIVIGTWTGTEENTKIKVDKITDPKFSKFNGDYEIVLVGLNPRTWEGTYTHPTTGRTRPMLVEVTKD